MSSYADRVRRNIAAIESNAQPPQRKRLSRQECQTVAKATGTIYAIVDLPLSPCAPNEPRTEPVSNVATYGYTLDAAKYPEQVYHPQHSPYGRVPGDVAAEETLEQLRQSAAKREIEERQAEERRAARERRPKG